MPRKARWFKREKVHLLGEMYKRLFRTGILTEERGVELLQGEIVHKYPTSQSRADSLDQAYKVLMLAVGTNADINRRGPLTLSDSVPEIDLTLTRRGGSLKTSVTANVLLAIQVADVSLESDREVKRAICAENGIREYWIVDLIDECVEVYRDLQPDWTYADVQTLRAGEMVTLVALPTITVSVADLF